MYWGKEMVTKKIRTLTDFTLKTTVGKEYRLVEDQVAVVEFGTEREFQQLMSFGRFVEANSSEPTRKTVLVLHPPVSEMEVEEIHPTTYLPECDLECGTQEVIEFHRRVRVEG